MENTILEAFFIPWWKGLLYVLAITLSAVVIRVSINFDLNEWLKSRETAKYMNEIKKRAERCRHAWTLYRSSPFSSCANCQAWISTSTLLAAMQYGDIKPIIFAEQYGVVAKHKGGMIVVNDYIGRDEE